MSTVASDGDYGVSGIKMFEEFARERNVCIAVREKVPSRASEAQFATIATNLAAKMDREKELGAKAVVMFVGAGDLAGLLRAFRTLNLSTDRWAFLVSDGLGGDLTQVENYTQLASGVLSLELQTRPIADFDQYFQNLQPHRNQRNPWFREYWEKQYRCRYSYSPVDDYVDELQLDAPPPATSSSRAADLQLRSSSSNPPAGNASLPLSPSPARPLQAAQALTQALGLAPRPRGPGTAGGGLAACTGGESASGTPAKQESKVQFVYHAVYAFAHAIDRLQRAACRTPKELCPEMLNFGGANFYKQYILNTSFRGTRICAALVSDPSCRSVACLQVRSTVSASASTSDVYN